VLLVIPLGVFVGAGGEVTLMSMSTLTVLGLTPFPLSLIEFRRARTPREAVFIMLFLIVQISYLSGETRSVTAAYRMVTKLPDDPASMLAFALGAIVFAVTSLPRVPETEGPIVGALVIATLCGLLAMPLLGWFGPLVLCVPVLCLACAYALADWIEGKVWASMNRKRAAAFRRRRGMGELAYGKLWLLAYLGDGAAAAAMGRSAPSPSLDLMSWTKGLDGGGLGAVCHAALALARMAHPHWDDAHPGDERARHLVDRVEECVDTPSAATRVAVEECLNEWGKPESWEAKVMHECGRAVAAEGGWAISTATSAIVRSVAWIAAEQGEDAPREAIRAELAPWAAGETGPA
jgi:hypothetical protein